MRSRNSTPAGMPVSFRSSSSRRAVRRPLSMLNRPSRSGSLNQSFPPDRGARLLEIDAHDDEQPVGERPARLEQARRILAGRSRVVDRARSGDDQEPVVLTGQDPANRLPGRVDELGGTFREGKLLKQCRRGDHVVDRRDPQVVRLVAHRLQVSLCWEVVYVPGESGTAFYNFNKFFNSETEPYWRPGSVLSIPGTTISLRNLVSFLFFNSGLHRIASAIRCFSRNSVSMCLFTLGFAKLPPGVRFAINVSKGVPLFSSKALLKCTNL